MYGIKLKTYIQSRSRASFVVLFALVGVTVIFAARAGNSSYIGHEAENGQITSPATIESDATASGGQYIAFRTSAPASSRYGIAAGGGLQYLSAANLATHLDGYKNLGAKWLRFDINWSDVQAEGSTSYNWSKYDAVIKAARARDLEVLGLITYTPTWARPPSCVASNKCAPADPATYAAFAHAVVDRYKTQGVTHWEVWNEANIVGYWKPRPDANAYATLLKAAYTSIKQADPEATVISTGMAPAHTEGVQINPKDFLAGLYAAGAKNSFDALGIHPYCYAGNSFSCPAQSATWNTWTQMDQTPVSLRSIMVANGDSNKKIWATEFGAPTNGSSQAVGETQQAQMVTAAYSLWRTYAWAGPLFWYSYKDVGTDPGDIENWFGLVRFDGTHKPAYAAYRNAATQ